MAWEELDVYTANEQQGGQKESLFQGEVSPAGEKEDHLLRIHDTNTI